jgi:PAS domain S-box-containing protein
MMNADISETIFVGKTEMARLMRSHDWSQTPLGAVETWPQSLRSTLSICLNSRFPIAIYWGADHLLLYNDAWRPIVGDKHPWSLGRPGREVWSEIWSDIGSELAGVLATGEGTFHKDDLLSMHRFGYTEECFFEYTFNPIQGQGVVEGVFNVVTETTYRVLNERRARLLREVAAKTGIAKTAEESCALIMEAFRSDPLDIPFALLYLIDPDGKSAYLCDSTESTPDSFISPATIDLTEPEGTDNWFITRAIQTVQPQVIADLPTRFGVLPGSPWSEPPQEAMVLPIAATSQGKVTGVLVAVVSPRRRLDEAYCDFLNQVAGQIAVAITQARAYEEERKRAEALAELDHAKTTFFNNVSHEFRTPLTLMLGPLEETLSRLDGRLPPSEQEQLQMVQRNGLRLLKLVNTLLDFSRIEAGRVQAVYELTDLAAFTSDLTSVFRSAIEQAGLRLQVDCPPLAEPTYVDREMWEKIVLNLLSNAFKFTFEGEIQVSVRLGAGESRSFAVLEVRDTGTGIPAEALPHIFERFHRVKGSRGRSYEGSGIGLSLVQELVRLHGGTIQVSSVVHQGTCFTVSIPTGCAHLPSESIHATSTLTSTATGAMPYVEEMLRYLPDVRNGEWEIANAGNFSGPASGSLLSTPVPAAVPALPARILLADDNADMRDYLKRLLSQHYEVEAVAEGAAVLARMRQQLPDLVLTDVMMPGIDGFEVLRSLRSDPATQNIPVILLSARAGEEARIEGLEAGADDYLTKPFSARELLARVEANLKLSQLRQEATQREQALRREAEAAQQRVEMVLSSISDGVYTLDRNWCFTYVNDRVCEMAGKSREELLGYSSWERFPEAVNTLAYVQMHQAMRDQIFVEFEYLDLAQDRWFEHRVYPSPDGLTVFLAEITDRKRIEAERRQTEAALRQSEEQFRQLADAMPQIVWIADAEGLPTYVSQRWIDYTALTLEQTADRNQIVQVIHPDDLEPVYAVWQECLAAGTLYETEFRLKQTSVNQPDNPYRWFLCRAVPIHNPQGQITQWYGTLTDLHEHKQAEAEIQQLNQQLKNRITELQTLFDLLPIGVAIAEDPTCQTIRVNPYLAELIRVPIEINASQSASTDERPLYRLYRDGEEIPVEHLPMQYAAIHNTEVEDEVLDLIHPDGTAVKLLSYCSPLLDEQGNVRGVLGAFVDITQRVSIETALRESEERLRMTIESAQLGTWDWNLVTNELIWDAGCKAMFGLSPDAQISIETFYSGLHPDERERLQDIVQWSLHPESGGSYDTEYRTIGIEDGIERWIAARGQAYFNSAGEPLRFIGTVLNITERKRIAAEREQLLAREQAAREEAEAANRIKDEFLAVVSHELRSPLSPILGWSKLLRSRQLDEQKTDRALEVIERNAQMQAQLINDLLDVSRILRGKLSLESKPVDLVVTIQSAIETVRLAAEAKSIDLRFAICDVGLEEGDNPKSKIQNPKLQVMGDSGRLQQVIWNLLTNAVKFTSEGGRVDIRLEHIDAQAQITINDTGKGIPADFLPYVFDRFRQESSSTTRRFGGLGLGLAIVRYLVELHGGTVQADSLGEGQGATFTVKLPLMLHQPTSTQETPPSEPSPELQGVRILVVDDDDNTREFLAFLLELHGGSVIATATASEALAVLTQFQPEVLVSDIGMPDVDGYMLMRQVRQLLSERGGSISAIALTAYAGEIDYQQAMAAGFQRHIAKPIEPQVLLQSIAQLRNAAMRERPLQE